MATSLATRTTENPSQVNDTMGDGKKARQGGGKDAIDRIVFNELIGEQFSDFMEYGDQKGTLHYCGNDHNKWQEACGRKHTLRKMYEEARDKLDEMHSYQFFRGGFLMGMDYAKSEGTSPTTGNTQPSPAQFDDIVKILTGTGHIPSVRQAFFDAVGNWMFDRHQAWGSFSFITNDSYKTTKEEAEQLSEKLKTIPEEYRKITDEYSFKLACMNDYVFEDGYFKGIIDGMEIQRLMQGTRERGEAQ